MDKGYAQCGGRFIRCRPDAIVVRFVLTFGQISELAANLGWYALTGRFDIPTLDKTCARHFLDLTGGAGAVIDQNLLAEP